MMSKILSVVRNIQFFGRNSWVLKVLAHEKSGEIPKKNWILNFHGMMKESIYLTWSRWTMCKILGVDGNI